MLQRAFGNERHDRKETHLLIVACSSAHLETSGRTEKNKYVFGVRCSARHVARSNPSHRRRVIGIGRNVLGLWLYTLQRDTLLSWPHFVTLCAGHAFVLAAFCNTSLFAFLYRGNARSHQIRWMQKGEEIAPDAGDRCACSMQAQAPAIALCESKMPCVVAVVPGIRGNPCQACAAGKNP